MLSKMIKVVILVALLGGLAYAGACIYGNFFTQSNVGDGLKLPSAEKAAYAVHIKNTGNLLLTNSFEQHGSVYILHGYFEIVGQGFKYREGDIILDEQIFGEITVRRRE